MKQVAGSTFEFSPVETPFPPYRQVMPHQDGCSPAVGCQSFDPQYLARLGVVQKAIDGCLSVECYLAPLEPGVKHHSSGDETFSPALFKFEHRVHRWTVVIMPRRLDKNPVAAARSKVVLPKKATLKVTKTAA